jgi:hypothetical protein
MDVEKMYSEKILKYNDKRRKPHLLCDERWVEIQRHKKAKNIPTPVLFNKKLVTFGHITTTLQQKQI